MIIKIMKEHAGEYWLIDNVESVHVGKIRDHQNQQYGICDSTIRKVMGSIMMDSAESAKVLETWSLDFKLKGDGENYSVIFNTVAYICNDDGRTIERVIG